MRIRSIHPQFWRSQDIAKLEREVRLLFIGLWSYVDDNGVGVDSYRQIAADLFALEDDPLDAREYVREGLATLSRGSLIARYEHNGKPLLYCPTWDKWQRVDKPGRARYPRPEDCGATIVTSDNAESESASGESFATVSGDPREGLAPGEGEKGRRGEEELSLTRASTAHSSSADADALFEKFWSVVPRRVGKKAARRRWDKAIKEVDPDTIIAAMARYADSVANTDEKFIVHPETWLNQGRWDDEPATPRQLRPAINPMDEWMYNR